MSESPTWSVYDQMTGNKIGLSFVQEFVLGFGFLSGLWIHVGVNPESEILRAFAQVVEELAPSSGFSLIFWLVPIIGLVASVTGSYFIGGWFGLVAVSLAFLGGVFIDSTFGVILLVVGVLLGFAAPMMRE